MSEQPDGEFNKLPEDYKGKQRRRTDFTSADEKLEHDARGLIRLVGDRYDKEGVTVRDALDLATRHDDDIEGLRRAIAIQIKGRPVELPDFEQFVDGLDLSDEDKGKLKEMMSEENFQKAVATAQERYPNIRIPSDAHMQIKRGLVVWGSPGKLEKICKEMERPKLRIVPHHNFYLEIRNKYQNKPFDQFYVILENETGDSDDTVASIVEGMELAK